MFRSVELLQHVKSDVARFAARVLVISKAVTFFKRFAHLGLDSDGNNIYDHITQPL